MSEPRRSPFEDVDLFDIWASGHYRRCNGRAIGLPDPKSSDGIDHYDLWRREMVKAGITSDEADEASDRVARNPPKAWEHLRTFLDTATAIRREREASASRQRGLTGFVADAGPDPEWDEAVERWKALTEDQRETRRRRIARERPDIRGWKGVLEAKAIESLIMPKAKAATR